MPPDAPRLAEHAEALLAAARELAGSTADPSAATQLRAALGRVGEALDALSVALERAPRALVPADDPGEPICRRFERAAAGWPSTHGCDGPSYERQAQLLASLYEAGATLRLSRRACARANELLVDMTARDDPAAQHGAAVGNGNPAGRPSRRS